MLENDLSPSMGNTTIYLRDYVSPPYKITNVKLDFQLGETTSVTSVLSIKRNGEHDEALVLDGEKIQLENKSILQAKVEKLFYFSFGISLLVFSVLKINTDMADLYSLLIRLP